MPYTWFLDEGCVCGKIDFLTTKKVAMVTPSTETVVMKYHFPLFFKNN